MQQRDLLDNVNMGVFPLAKGSSALDGNPLLSLEVHAVHLGAHSVLAAHIMDGIDPACVKEDSLRQRRLAAKHYKANQNETKRIVS